MKELKRERQRKLGVYNNASWNWEKIFRLMNLGMGDPNQDWITSLKRGSTYNHTNRSTYFRINLFLCPFTQILFTNWH
jgi:hypothetical protein